MTQRRWNRQRIIAAIQERQQRGLKLTDVDEHDVGLAQAARAYFGGWSAAVQAAGFTPAYPKWNQERVLKAILDRRRQGLSLQRVWGSDRPLYLAAHRHFGSWQNALEAAGIKGRRRQQWSKQRVLTELRVWYRTSNGEHSEAESPTDGRHHQVLRQPAKRPPRRRAGVSTGKVEQTLCDRGHSGPVRPRAFREEGERPGTPVRRSAALRQLATGAAGRRRRTARVRALDARACRRRNPGPARAGTLADQRLARAPSALCGRSALLRRLAPGRAGGRTIPHPARSETLSKVWKLWVMSVASTGR